MFEDLLLADPFDPRTWDTEPAPDATFAICLSNRWDLNVLLDYQDYVWAKDFLWCHTYGSGKYLPWMNALERPDGIYARRSVQIDGFLPSGRPRYGNLFLHCEILTRWKGPRRPYRIGDHRNGNTLDCRRRNLRWATKSQNSKNVPGSRIRKRFLTQEAQCSSLA
jgi:hypothetical protein